MDSNELRQMLGRLREGELSVEQAMGFLEQYPFADLGHTKLDTHRELRSGFGEVVFAGKKSAEELIAIVNAAVAASGRVLLTRLQPEQMAALRGRFPALEVFERSGTARLGGGAAEQLGKIGVVTAGTSDAGVAEEARVSAEYFGLSPSLITDVGVAGLPRLLAALPQLKAQDLLIVIAGMEGALPSVVAGLTAAPVIAVPTSVGYGATFNGLTALLSMLVSCSPGLTVVNIDNGFGAALAAAKILRHLRRHA